MGVNNRIATRKPLPDTSIEYKVNEETVRLSASIVRNYLTSGNGNVTDAEVAYFINMCKYQKLNPLTKDAYLVKYGSQPAAIIVGKDALLKRAMHNPKYAGHQAGVIVLTDSGELEYRTGALLLDGDKLAGGWAKVYVKGYDVPIESAVSFREYVGTKGDGSMNSMWSGKPATMIRKVALVTALRESFPDDLAQLYTAEEVDAGNFDEAMEPVDIEQPPAAEIQVDIEEPTAQPEQATMDELPGGF